ncbi:unnamed protein product [Brassicogethes aeneus]|uniref:Uncharacterized protein n=1 Tax=Brassicogethes aeneus TaxID=1431903 RepID=A0A9P0AWM7_BRAAE|nr:unnamed protein product [Brassicogethes aeneus]
MHFIFSIFFIALIVLNKTYSEWVEITQTKESNTDFPILDSTSTIQRPVVFTTTSDYETLMRTAYSTHILTATSSKIMKNDFVVESTIFKPNVIPKRSVAKIKRNNTGNVERINTGSVERIKVAREKVDNMDFDKFLPLVKSIQKNLLKNEGKSVINKISILKNLKDTILMNLNDKISKLWMPQEVNREARGYKDEHHMEFPSNEGALMTIGFLTFAVFLIKLVLKLIYALKYKKEYYSTSTTTTTVATLFIRKRRDIEEENNRILQLIEEFKLD